MPIISLQRQLLVLLPITWLDEVSPVTRVGAVALGRVAGVAVKAQAAKEKP